MTQRVRFLHGVRVASTSRRSALMQLALMCGGLTLATWGCGFSIFRSFLKHLARETQQAKIKRRPYRETEVCDDLCLRKLASDSVGWSEAPETRSGTTRYRDYKVSAARKSISSGFLRAREYERSQHADAAGWVQAGNFTKWIFSHRCSRVRRSPAMIRTLRKNSRRARHGNYLCGCRNEAGGQVEMM